MDTLVAMLRDLIRDVGKEVRDLDTDALTWQPHPKANSVGVTVWHLARWFDLLAHRIFRGLDASEELWHRDGWRDGPDTTRAASAAADGASSVGSCCATGSEAARHLSRP